MRSKKTKRRRAVSRPPAGEATGGEATPTPGGFEDGSLPSVGAPERRFELEDLLLAGFVVLLDRFLGRNFDGFLTSPLVLAGALLGVALCVFSRGPEDTSQQEMELRRAVLGIPAALILLGLVLDPGAPGRLRNAIVAFLVLTILVNGILAFLRKTFDRLPSLDRATRRVLVAPAQLLGVALFERQLRPDLLQSALLADKPGTGRLVVLGLATLLLYWSAVVGPRILAAGSKSPVVWGPRFLLYFATVAMVVWRGGQW
jgi:hypothetical protein